MKKEKLIEAKQGALMSLVDAMQSLELEKVKGFKNRKDKKPVMEAEVEEVEVDEVDEDELRELFGKKKDEDEED
jgi:hypothetical protein